MYIVHTMSNFIAHRGIYMYPNLSKFFKQFLTYTNSRFLETQSKECRGAIGILGKFLSRYSEQPLKILQRQDIDLQHSTVL